MNKQILCNILLLLLLLIFTGCSDSKVNSDANEVVTEAEDTTQGNNDHDGEGELTIEYLCNNYGMKESDFDDVDFDAFVDYYGLTKENIKNDPPKPLLEEYKQLKYKVKIPNYNDYKTTTDKFLSDYNSNIETVIIDEYVSSGVTGTSEITVLDFGLGFAFSPRNLRFVSENDIVKEISDEEKNRVVECINKNDLCNLEKQSEDTSSEQVEDGQPSTTKLMIKMKDGTVYGVSYFNTSNPTDGEKLFFDFIRDIKMIVKG